MAVGPGARNDAGATIPMAVAVGDKVDFRGFLILWLPGFEASCSPLDNQTIIKRGHIPSGATIPMAVAVGDKVDFVASCRKGMKLKM